MLKMINLVSPYFSRAKQKGIRQPKNVNIKYKSMNINVI